MLIKIQPADEAFTSQYEYHYTVLRRGISFFIVCYIREWKQYLDLDAKITLSINNKTFKISRGSRTSSEGWTCMKQTSDRLGTISIRVTSPNDAYVGRYSGKIEFLEPKPKVGTFKFVLFFNPWNPYDETFMEQPDLRSECINNQTTAIYFGNSSNVSHNIWYLSQFQAPAIEACILLLSRISPVYLKSAPMVARKFSALVNANDDNGILIGNWSKDYSGGENPMSWSGSLDILRKYVNTNRPVGYGQCWVYAGLLCTLCRCVGIPCRIITTYDSFHDANSSLEWEVYYDENMNEIEKAYDSVWNFHCWNEAWMQRSDIGMQFNGWQIIDSTPQERSGEFFRLGPSPKYAVKEGLVKTQYDTGFVFAEVNADKYHYIYMNNGKHKLFLVEKGKVGTKIVTKDINSYRPLDLTSSYKYPDNSEMDKIIDRRISPYTRSHGASPTTNIDDITRNDNITNPAIQIKILSHEKVSATSNYKAHVYFKSAKNENGTLYISSNLTSFSGTVISNLFSNSYQVSTEFRTKLSLPFLSHLSDVSEGVFIKTNVIYNSSSSNIRKTENKKTYIEFVYIKITKIPSAAKVGVECYISIRIHNASRILIKKQRIYVESTCLSKRHKGHINDTSEPIIDFQLKIIPVNKGFHYFSVYLESSNYAMSRGVGKLYVT